MSLEIDVLERNKNTFNPKSDLSASNYGIWDLTKSSISFSGVEIRIKNVVLVTEYFQMRPDLVSLVNFDGQKNMGFLLKFNGLSNPFAISEGTPIAIPTTETRDNAFSSKQMLNQKAISSNTNTNPNESFRKNQEQKKFKISEGRKKFLSEKIKRKAEMVLPPNVTQPNERSVIRENGFFVFAPDAGASFNTPQTL